MQVASGEVLLEQALPPPTSPPAEVSPFRAFADADTDSSGSLTLAELRVALSGKSKMSDEVPHRPPQHTRARCVHIPHAAAAMHALSTLLPQRASTVCPRLCIAGYPGTVCGLRRGRRRRGHAA